MKTGSCPLKTSPAPRNTFSKRHSLKVHVSNNFRRLRTSQPWPIHSTHPVRQCTTKLKLRQLCNKIHVYFYLQKYPNWENKENVCPICPTTQKPRIHFQLGWTITKLIHVQIYFQAHPVKALQLTSTYQCCMQAQS